MANEQELREFGRLATRIAKGGHMSRQEAEEAYRQVILNEQPELQQGAFLMAHVSKGPSIEELSGAWDALYKYDTSKIVYEQEGTVCDIVGTGSDSLKTVNCSTPAALIASACGLTVAKKGARLVTGVSGASDIMEYFGVALDGPLSAAAKCLHEHGICYLPGESFLESGWARLIQHMRFTSAFNIIGPLTMPCEQTKSIVIGAYSPKVCRQLVSVLREIGMDAALAPYGMDRDQAPDQGMDEFSTCGVTHVVELKNGDVTEYDLVPEDFGVNRQAFGRIASGDNVADNAMRIKAVLDGQYDTPDADFFAINTSAALVMSGIARDWAQGVEMARQAIATGAAKEKLQWLCACQGQG